jgi:diguanylate cyclase (GGDEF)-like protein/PAS domain S-box-containing protein
MHLRDKNGKRPPVQSGISPDDLRQRAEKVLNGNPLEMGGLSTQDVQFVIHELQVHQVELQLQNEELLRLQQELEISRDNYSSLFDFAPVAYFTLDPQGIIQETNQMGAELLGVKKGTLLGQRLAHFIHPDDQDLFYLHHRQTRKTQKTQDSEIRIVASNGTIHHVQIQSVASGDQGDQIRVVLSDITERKKIEQTVRESEQELAQRFRELNALHEATSSLLSTLDTDILLTRILDSALKAIPAAITGVIFLAPSDSRRLIKSTFARSTNADQETLTFSNRSRYITKVLSTKQRLVLSDIKTQTGKDGANLQRIQKTKSALLVPLVTEDQTYGVISLEALEKSAFSETEIDLLESFAATATAALRNARLHEQLQETAITDFLTKLYNRQGFFEIGQHEFQRFLRSARPLSLIAIDIDGFKAINDTFGHAAGDQVLILLGQRLIVHLRKADVMARYGGDEFMVLLPETDLATALKIVKRLNRAMAEAPFQIGDQSIYLTISQGVSQAAKGLQDLNGLIKQADEALYLAKAAGRNCIQSS